MAEALKTGDTVYVPCTSFIELQGFASALYRTTVVSVVGTRISVGLPNGAVSKPYAASRAHRDVGIMIVELGDFDSEAATLDPLTKSVLQFCRLLVPDDQLRSVKVRSLAELRMFWAANHVAYSHIILIGHGDHDCLGFAVDGDVSAAKLSSALEVPNVSPKLFISLACKTGYKSFGGAMSKAAICRDFIAPFHVVHSATASQFCQSFLTKHFVDGKTTKVAFNYARKCVPSGITFRLWHNGSLLQ